MKNENISSVRGVIPPLLTPLTRDGDLDLAGVERLLTHVIDGGVDGVFVLGTSGEAASLAFDTRRTLIEETTRMVAGRVPVLVGATATCPAETVDVAGVAQRAGADAVVVAPPFYYPVSQDELIEYYRQLAMKLPLPIFLYNPPGFPHLRLEPDAVRALADVSLIAGIKDSSCDMLYAHTLLRTLAGRDDFPVFVGAELLMAETVLYGGAGAVSGMANLVPHWVVDLYRAARAQDGDAIRAGQARLGAFCDGLLAISSHRAAWMKGAKCVLAALGVCEPWLASPLRTYGPSEREKIQDLVEELEIQLPVNV